MPVDKKSLPSGVNVSLTPLEETGDTLRYPVSEVPAYIGSGGHADVMVPGEGVAEAHARLTWTDDSLYLEDLGQGTTRINDR
ncbi:MAG: FHA domain-containing protein, partial [bacterium]